MSPPRAAPAPPPLQQSELRWETRLLAVITVTLTVFGVASAFGAANIASGPERALAQFIGALGGLLLMSILARVDYQLWRRLAWPILLGTIVLLLVPILPFTPDAIAPMRNGARRWIRLGGFSFQPSEVARFAVVVWCAMLAAKKGPQLREFKFGVLPFLVVLGTISLLIMLEPSLSMAVLVAMLGGIILFSAGAKIGHFLVIGAAGVLLVFHQIRDAHYRISRWVTFLNPGEASADAKRQITESLVSMGSGRLLGVGFGEGHQKLGFLPFADSDFLFSAIGQEWGFIGVVLVVVLFGLFCWLGFRIARTARDPFGQYLAVGFTAAVGVTAFMHMAVTLSLMPTTGITLPFMSFGRSSLVVTLAGTGILLSVGQRRGRPAKP